MSSILESAANAAFGKAIATSSKRQQGFLTTASSSSSSSSIDRALGAAASLGLSLAILRIVFNVYNSHKRIEYDNDDEKGEAIAEEDKQPQRGFGGSRVLVDALLSSLRRFLRRILIDEKDGGYDASHLYDTSYEYNMNDGAMITHQGSCHCESVRFEAVAPRCLATQDGPGKIQFRRTEIKASKFQVVEGRESLKTYYVYCPRTARRGAHVFCGRCGVNILFAPDKTSTTIYLNVNCMAETGIRKLRSTPTLATIADGVAVEGQWDDQLSTISEVSSDSLFMKRLYSQNSTMSSSDYSSSCENWKSYPAPAYDSNEILQTPCGSSSIAEGKPYPAMAPITPTTVDSLTATDSSHMSSYRAPTSDQDSLMTMTEEETDSPTAAISLNAAPLKSSMLRTPLPSKQGTVQTTATPQVRDQMKYFMRKHLSPAPAPPQQAATAATTSTTNAAVTVAENSVEVEEEKKSN